jgi:hypothetical protein
MSLVALLARFVGRAEHDHAVAEGELGVLDAGVVRAEVDGVFLEAEGGDEPVDGGEGVAVAKAGDDGGASGFGRVGRWVSRCVSHSVRMLSGWSGGRLGKNGSG